ncbi:MAG: hypothetical protein WCW63_01680 [Acholeplasmataceae bacterium]|nr:hypothetical protein [Methanolobus sp.]
MNKKTRRRIADISFHIAIIIGILFLIAYIFCFELPLIKIAIAIEIVAILVFLWSEK